jgi:hypothetical protein
MSLCFYKDTSTQSHFGASAPQNCAPSAPSQAKRSFLKPTPKAFQCAWTAIDELITSVAVVKKELENLHTWHVAEESEEAIATSITFFSSLDAQEPKPKHSAGQNDTGHFQIAAQPNSKVFRQKAGMQIMGPLYFHIDDFDDMASAHHTSQSLNDDWHWYEVLKAPDCVLEALQIGHDDDDDDDDVDDDDVDDDDNDDYDDDDDDDDCDDDAENPKLHLSVMPVCK